MMNRNGFLKDISFFLTVLLLLPLVVHAQWSADPTQNLGIAVVDGDQATPKMEATSDGGCYICWFDNRTGSYCMYLQLLDADGYPQFAENGLLVSDHEQMTWLVDYDLAVDQEDNAIIVFGDMRNGTTNDLDVVTYKIGPDGSFIWGADGVVLSRAINSDFEAAPKVTVTSDNEVVFAWPASGTTSNLIFQRLSAAGVKLWGENGFTLYGTADYDLAAVDLAPGENGSAIAIWKNSSGPFWAPFTVLYSQKYDASGNAAWTAGDVLLYDMGEMSAWTYPEIMSDGNGGAFYAYHDSPTSSQFTVWMQHVDLWGNRLFPVNGMEASTSLDRLHMNASMTYISTSDELFLFWVEASLSQTQYGVYGQKFDAAGNRLWTDNGLELVPLSDEQISFVNSGAAGNDLYVSYFQDASTINDAVKALMVDDGGAMQWGPVLLSSADLGTKDDLLMVVNTQGRAFCSWNDNRSGGGDIYAQNVNQDGTLGNQGAPSVTITLTPETQPIVIPAAGGTFGFNVGVANSSTASETFDLWTTVTLPGGTEYGPIINVQDFTAPGSWSADRDRTQNVPANAPSGQYTYNGFVGVYPDEVWDEDHFDFEKSTTADGLTSVIGDWNCSGEPFTAAAAALLPSQTELLSSYPNPFNPTTMISYRLADVSLIHLAVYDVTGRKAADLIDGWRDAGLHQITFDASHLASGIYFVRLTTGVDVYSEKIILMK